MARRNGSAAAARKVAPQSADASPSLSEVVARLREAIHIAELLGRNEEEIGRQALRPELRRAIAALSPRR